MLNNTVIIFHYYTNVNPPFHFHLAHYLRESAKLERPLFLTEYDFNTFHEVSTLSKQYNLSWSIWEYKDFCKDGWGACKTGYGGYFYTASGGKNLTSWESLKQLY